MTARTWLYHQLTSPSNTELYSLIEGRAFAKKTMSSSVEAHPYLIFKLGNDTNEELSETEDIHRQFIQIYVHDYTDVQTADYMKIDEVIRALKNLLSNAQSEEDGIISVIYLETSQDLNDLTLGTVMKYVRFVMICKG